MIERWVGEILERMVQPNDPSLSAEVSRHFLNFKFTDAEREALATHDYVALFEMGAHNFLTLTLFIALFERDYAEPLAFQREYATRLSHWSVPYPDIST